MNTMDATSVKLELTLTECNKLIALMNTWIENYGNDAILESITEYICDRTHKTVNDLVRASAGGHSHQQ